MKANYTVITLTCMLSILTVVTAMPPVQCNPGYVSDVPLRIRKICIALSTIYELGSAMENYVNDIVPVTLDGDLLMDNGVKRHDAEHVFLRFGKRSILDKMDRTEKFKIPLDNFA